MKHVQVNWSWKSVVELPVAVQTTRAGSGLNPTRVDPACPVESSTQETEKTWVTRLLQILTQGWNGKEYLDYHLEWTAVRCTRCLIGVGVACSTGKRETRVRFPDRANFLLSYCFTSLNLSVQHMATTAGLPAGPRLFSILCNHGARDQRGDGVNCRCARCLVSVGQ